MSVTYGNPLLIGESKNKRITQWNDKFSKIVSPSISKTTAPITVKALCYYDGYWYGAGRWFPKGGWYTGHVRTDRVNNNLFAINLKKKGDNPLNILKPNNKIITLGGSALNYVIPIYRDCFLLM